MKLVNRVEILVLYATDNFRLARHTKKKRANKREFKRANKFNEGERRKRKRNKKCEPKPNKTMKNYWQSLFEKVRNCATHTYTLNGSQFQWTADVFCLDRFVYTFHFNFSLRVYFYTECQVFLSVVFSSFHFICFN